MFFLCFEKNGVFTFKFHKWGYKIKQLIEDLSIEKKQINGQI